MMVGVRSGVRNDTRRVYKGLSAERQLSYGFVGRALRFFEVGGKVQILPSNLRPQERLQEVLGRMDNAAS